MSKIKGYFEDWSLFEKCWLVFVCSIMVIIWFLNGDTPFMLVLSLTGSLNLVLGAKGKVAGLYFAIINSALYAYQCIDVQLFGEVMYNILYSIPVSLIAIYLWKKNSSASGEVKFRTMSLKFALIVAAGTVIGIFGYSKLLTVMGGSFVFMDSLTTVISVIASMLYLFRYSEQWLLWVIVNALSIVMWIMVLMSGDSSALLIIVMKTVNLLNSLYGYRNWRKISKRVENSDI